MKRKRKRGDEPAGRVPPVQYITGSPGPTIRAGARTWRLGFNTQNAKARLEELVRAQVVRDALRLKRETPGEDGEQVWQDARDALAAGHYDTFEKGWFRVVKSNVGAKLFLLSLLQKNHPEATEADALALLTNEPEQTEAAVAVVAPDFFRAMVAQVAAERGLPVDERALIATLTTAAPGPATASA